MKNYSVTIRGKKDVCLNCKFKETSVPFSLIASTGTRSLALFYYLYIKMSSASFVYIDEYDAFYHFELSQALVELIKQLPNTQVFMSTYNTDLISNDILRPDTSLTSINLYNWIYKKYLKSLILGIKVLFLLPLIWYNSVIRITEGKVYVIEGL